LTYSALGPRRGEVLAACGSARELAERGFADDVALCLAEDATDTACRLERDRFIAVPVL
jgi:2-phosphosulfolactate phosphatase